MMFHHTNFLLKLLTKYNNIIISYVIIYSISTDNSDENCFNNSKPTLVK